MFILEDKHLEQPKMTNIIPTKFQSEKIQKEINKNDCSSARQLNSIEKGKVNNEDDDENKKE